jgi:hypothetical protein
MLADHLENGFESDVVEQRREGLLDEDLVVGR